MSKTVKDLATLSMIVALGVAVLLNPGAFVAVIRAIGSGWNSLLLAISGQTGQAVSSRQRS